MEEIKKFSPEAQTLANQIKKRVIGRHEFDGLSRPDLVLLSEHCLMGEGGDSKAINANYQMLFFEVLNPPPSSDR